jgi:microcompartment protein CcmK/EutM
MIIGRVVGEVVATIKHPKLEQQKLLLVQPTAPDGTPTGKVVLAVDQAQAGPGDRVLVLDEGNGAAQVLGRPRGPVRTVIVGVVDAVELATPETPAAPATPPRRARSGRA